MINRAVKKFSWLIGLVALAFAVCAPALGQDTLNVGPGADCPQKDLPDLIRAARHKPPKVKSESAGSLLIVPVIGSNPATGFILGVGGQYAFKMTGSTLYSNFSG